MSQTVREIATLVAGRAFMSDTEYERYARSLAAHVLASPTGAATEHALDMQLVSGIENMARQMTDPHVLAFPEPQGERPVSRAGYDTLLRDYSDAQKVIADLRAQLQAAQQEAHKTFARHEEVVDNMLAGLAAYEEQVLSLEQLADERGREVERLRAAIEAAPHGNCFRVYGELCNCWHASALAIPAATPPAEEKET